MCAERGQAMVVDVKLGTLVEEKLYWWWDWYLDI